MASLECLDCCVADVKGSVIWKFVLVFVIVSLLLVGHLRAVLSAFFKDSSVVGQNSHFPCPFSLPSSQDSMRSPSTAGTS